MGEGLGVHIITFLTDDIHSRKNCENCKNVSNNSVLHHMKQNEAQSACADSTNKGVN